MKNFRLTYLFAPSFVRPGGLFPRNCLPYQACVENQDVRRGNVHPMAYRGLLHDFFAGDAAELAHEVWEADGRKQSCEMYNMQEGK